MTYIEDIHGRIIIDSRGNKTVEVEVLTESGFLGTSSAPSGASTGRYEVKAWAKGGPEGSLRQLKEVVLPKLQYVNTLNQEEVDEALKEADGTEDFRNIGGNLATAVSLASAKAAADSLDMPLYRYIGGINHSKRIYPFGNILGGGAHAVGGTDIQEFMSVAMGGTIKESVIANAFAHKSLKELLKKRFPAGSIGKGDEGAWVAPLDNIEALKLVSEAVEAASSKMDIEMGVALDLAASEFFSDGMYRYGNLGGGKKEKALTPEEQVDFVEGLIDEYSLVSVEDPFDQNDFSSYVELTKRVGSKCLIIGDDIFVTNPARIERGVKEGAATGILIKVNQIGTLSGAQEAVSLGHSHGWKTVISHRSGETTDSSIAHLGIGFGCYGIKTGAVGGERIAKLNELIRIEEDWKEE